MMHPYWLPASLLASWQFLNKLLTLELMSRGLLLGKPKPSQMMLMIKKGDTIWAQESDLDLIPALLVSGCVVLDKTN